MIKTVIIRKGSIEEAIAVSKQIPEFYKPYAFDEYAERLGNSHHLIAIAEVNSECVGFKVGYQRDNDQSLYSWMGGVLPKYRKEGVARQLADFQEDWAKNEGFTTIRMKTRNRLKAMLHFALGNGFYIIGVDQFEDPGENRIWLEKKLN